MHKLLLYDPRRSPPDWSSLIRPGQYAVFLNDVRSFAPVANDGVPLQSAADHFCLLFDSLAEAETYCRESVNRVPRLRCEVFDSQGRLNPPVAVFVNQEFEHTIDTPARGNRLIGWGVACLALSVPLFFYAWISGAAVVWWPVLVGINVALAGLRLIHWGHGLKEELRYREKEAANRLRQSRVP